MTAAPSSARCGADDLPFSCVHCGAKFSSLQALGGHKSVHGGKRRGRHAPDGKGTGVPGAHEADLEQNPGNPALPSLHAASLGWLAHSVAASAWAPPMRQWASALPYASGALVGPGARSMAFTSSITPYDEQERQAPHGNAQQYLERAAKRLRTMEESVGFAQQHQPFLLGPGQLTSAQLAWHLQRSHNVNCGVGLSPSAVSAGATPLRHGPHVKLHGNLSEPMMAYAGESAHRTGAERLFFPSPWSLAHIAAGKAASGPCTLALSGLHRARPCSHDSLGAVPEPMRPRKEPAKPTLEFSRLRDESSQPEHAAACPTLALSVGCAGTAIMRQKSEVDLTLSLKLPG